MFTDKSVTRENPRQHTQRAQDGDDACVAPIVVIGHACQARPSIRVNEVSTVADY
jgi:hypothetical protein